MNRKYTDFLNLIVYQVYPRSFCDGNGDGIGDLRGVIRKLDYLRSLGVNAVWLSPCFKSPNVDNGYDIADYRDIMEDFGTLEDARCLIEEMHKRGMKIIMDLVPNHTSTEHRWFQESRKSKDNPYSDYYYWADEPLNDWQSLFGGTAWQYDELRGQYYLHSYAVEQADLNWENPAVVREMQEIVDFWVDLGVDGFRCDVIDQISKDFDGVSYEGGRNCFGPTLHEHIRALFGREKTAHLFTVGECWCDDIDEMERHEKDDRGELSTLFQFDHMECGRSDKWTKKPESLRKTRDILIKWQTLCYERDLLYTLFTDNHDQPRFISRMGDDGPLRFESATAIAAMFYTLRGIPFIYEGQEFGTPNPYYDSMRDFDDVECLNAYAAFRADHSEREAMEKINFGSRDNARRPMTWSGGKNGGFSEADPWITPHSRADEINLESDLASGDRSVFRFYQKLLALRASSRPMIYGDLRVLSKPDDEFFVFTRSFEGETVLVIVNFAEASVIDTPFANGSLLLSNYGGRQAPGGAYAPYETAVFAL